MTTSWLRKRSLLSGVLFGTASGVGFRVMAQLPAWIRTGNGSLVMTAAFLIIVPVLLGFITVVEAQHSKPRPVWQWIFLPWIPLVLSFLIVYLLNLEGLICILLALPIALISSSVGGLAAGLVQKYLRKPTRTSLACIALLPILLAPLEMQLPPRAQYRTVRTEILIHAAVPIIWKNIEQVKAISPHEIPPTWTHAIGFPLPVAATLSYPGVGGVRHASFQNGLLFIETINKWDEGHILAFSIKADTQHIPPTTLDEHVTIGGRYFDVLNGEYSLEPHSGGNVILHLSSQERLSTDFNSYAGLWTDALMRSLQQSILQVIKHRCEA